MLRAYCPNVDSGVARKIMKGDLKHFLFLFLDKVAYGNCLWSLYEFSYLIKQTHIPHEGDEIFNLSVKWFFLA